MLSKIILIIGSILILSGCQISMVEDKAEQPIINDVEQPTQEAEPEETMITTQEEDTPALLNDNRSDDEILAELTTITENIVGGSYEWEQYSSLIAKDEMISYQNEKGLSEKELLIKYPYSRLFFSGEIVNYPDVGFNQTHKQVDRYVDDETAILLYEMVSDKDSETAAVYCYPFKVEEGKWKMKVPRLISKDLIAGDIKLEDENINKICSEFILPQQLIGEQKRQEFVIEGETSLSMEIYINGYLVGILNGPEAGIQFISEFEASVPVADKYEVLIKTRGGDTMFFNNEVWPYAARLVVGVKGANEDPVTINPKPMDDYVTTIDMGITSTESRPTGVKRT